MGRTYGARGSRVGALGGARHHLQQPLPRRDLLAGGATRGAPSYACQCHLQTV